MKILYLSTFFHEYHDKIIEHLTVNLGNKVEKFVLEKRSTYLSIIRLVSIIRYQQTRHEQYLKILSFSDDYDLVFIQSPYFLPIDILSSLRKKLKRAKFISYSWDSIKSTYELEYFKFFDRFFSFDPDDCANHKELQYLPLFYTADFTPSLTSRRYDIAFVGGIGDSSDRYCFIKQIMSQCEQNNLSYYFYPRIPINYFIKSLLRGVYHKRVKFKSISLKQISVAYRNARCVLDQNNPLQKGMTMRTFEAIASGCRLITTNDSIINEPFYDKRYISIIDRANPIIDIDFINQKDIMDSQFLMLFSKYNLSNWIRMVFYE